MHDGRTKTHVVLTISKEHITPTITIQLYGELVKSSMQKIINYLKNNTNFNQDSIFLDIGSGFGKPNIHVAFDPGVSLSIGVECDEGRYNMSLSNLHNILTEEMFIVESE